jgi:hypothetical protein
VQVWESHTVEVPCGKRIQTTQVRMRFSFWRLFSLRDRGAEFRSWYCQTLVVFPFEAFFFEQPPFSTKTFDSETEFVLPDLPFESEFANQPNTDVLV